MYRKTSNISRTLVGNKIKKVVNVNHVCQYKDKGMCNRLGVIGVDVDADMCV